MILLTGATGKCGSAAAKELLNKGAPVRVLVRDAAKAADLKAAGADVAVGDATDAASVDQALAGCDRAVLILPNSEAQLDMELQFIDRAKAAGVKHLVKLSSMEASPQTSAPIPQLHWAVEDHLRASSLAWTMIRPNFFMQNLLANAVTIKSMNKFFLPLGDARTCMIDSRDIGAVIAAVLTSDGHENQSYEVTGPELLTFYEVADIFTEVLGRKIEYVNQPMDSYKETLAQFLTNEWHLNAVCALFGEIAKGGLDRKTDAMQTLTGREPITLASFVGDYKMAFQPD